jgi:hypothetical protein
MQQISVLSKPTTFQVREENLIEVLASWHPSRSRSNNHFVVTSRRFRSRILMSAVSCKRWVQVAARFHRIQVHRIAADIPVFVSSVPLGEILRRKKLDDNILPGIGERSVC